MEKFTKALTLFPKMETLVCKGFETGNGRGGAGPPDRSDAREARAKRATEQHCALSGFVLGPRLDPVQAKSPSRTGGV